MTFIPELEFSQFIDLERICKAEYEFQMNPSDGNKEKIIQLAQQLPQYFTNTQNRFRPNTMQSASVVMEERFFKDKYHVAVVRHPRYSPKSWHMHDFFELIYAYEGSCEHSIQTENFVMHEGDFCILSPNMPHAMVTNQDDSLIVNILIRRSTFEKIFNYLLDGFDLISQFFKRTLYDSKVSSFLLFKTKEDLELKKIVKQMYDEYISKSSYSAQILDSYLGVMLGLLLRHNEGEVYKIEQGGKKTINIAEILSYIETNFNTITLPALADHFFYNTNYLSKLLKEATGKNFRDIIREERLNQAADLLSSTDLPVDIIIDRVGYNDTSHFYQNFKNQFGTSPTHYRTQTYL